MKRSDVLKTADEHVNGTRVQQYGDVKDNFRMIAAMWTALFGVQVDPDQVAIAMIMVKASRLAETPGHSDSWVDIAGYAALGSEVADSEMGETTVHMELPAPIPASTTGHVEIVLPEVTEELTDKPAPKRKATS